MLKGTDMPLPLALPLAGFSPLSVAPIADLAGAGAASSGAIDPSLGNFFSSLMQEPDDAASADDEDDRDE
jgi:hypothetical protein